MSKNKRKKRTAAWRDNGGQTWSLTITVNTIKRVKQLVGVNLLEVFDGKLLGQLAEDPVLLVNTLYAVCQPQAEQREVSEEAFGESLVGDAIEQAAEALVQGLIDFFPQARRAVLARLWRATTEAQSQAVQLASDKLKSPLLNQALSGAMRKASDEIDLALAKFGEPSTNSPASSA